MINIPLTKILFLDIETVGVQPDWDSLVKHNEALSFQFEHYFDWFQKRFPEEGLSLNQRPLRFDLSLF